MQEFWDIVKSNFIGSGQRDGMFNVIFNVLSTP